MIQSSEANYRGLVARSGRSPTVSRQSLEALRRQIVAKPLWEKWPPYIVGLGCYVWALC